MVHKKGKNQKRPRRSGNTFKKDMKQEPKKNYFFYKKLGHLKKECHKISSG